MLQHDTDTDETPEPDHATLPRGSSGPLDGLRVIELGSIVAAPFAARLVADLGADVIKVEAPDAPDAMRGWGHGTVDGRSLWWPLQARNKRLVTINLRQQQGQDLFTDLAAGVDAVIENFRPGTLERWNLGYERLAEANPGLVLVRISGFGQTGPSAPRASYAAVAEAVGGLRYINGYGDRPPPRFGISLGDSLGSLFAVQGLLAAIHERDVTGSGLGQIVDVSLAESSFALLESAVAEYDRLGIVREPSGSRLKNVAPSNLYTTRDEQWVVIAANQDSLFRRLCAAMGRPELATDSRFADHASRSRHQDEIEQLVQDWARAHEAAELEAVLEAHGVAFGRVQSVRDIVADPQYRAREMLVEHDDEALGPILGPGVVPKFSRTPGAIRWSGRWEAGRDNAEVLGPLRAADALRALHDDGVI
ncbi:MAG: formyl-CoA transferase [Solirubrobacteraceae bacterium]